MEKKINYFKITTYLENGDVWETIRHTDDVVRFCVEEKYSA